MYTNVYQRGNYLYVRGVENGQRFNQKVDFQPTLWVKGKLKTGSVDEWHTLDGQRVYAVNPGSMYDCKTFVDQYKDVHGFEVFESTGHVYQYIAETYPDDIRWDASDIRISILDIETATEYGFPEPALAQEEILLITVKEMWTGNVITFGSKPYAYASERPDAKYVHCSNEVHLLKEFMIYWVQNYPDVVSGWNTTLFDNPYLFNRITKVLGDSSAAKLSPWNNVKVRALMFRGKEEYRCDIHGIAQLDYLDLYKKFTYGAQESYRLDYIAEVEIGENKLEMPGDSFKDNYTNHWDIFVKYNIHDVELVEKLDDKMKFFDLAFTMAYDAKIQFEDVYSPVKMWDNIIYNYLLKQKIVIPRRNKVSDNQASYQGGYVKEPLIGRHKWAASFDLNSLYPMLICQYNMSPETLVEDMRLSVNVDTLLESKADLSYAFDNDYCVTGSGCLFRKDKKGLLPTLMQLYYDRRVLYKKEMLKTRQLHENTKDDKYLKEIARLNNLQMAVKIAINSAYGAFANAWFRYSDVRIAESITLSGQLSIRWIANRLNSLLNKTMKTDDVDRVVLIDTDSVVLTLEDLVEKVCEGKTTEQRIAYMDKIAETIIQPYLDKSYQELADMMNAYEQKMAMKRENLVDVMISVAKKRYVMNVHNSEGVQYKQPKLKVMGLDMVKSSTPAVVRSKLRDFLKVVLHGDQSDVQKYVAEYKSSFRSLAPHEIAFPRGVNNVSQYMDKTTLYKKATPIHVRGAILYNHHLKRLGLDKKYPSIKNGDKIKFVYLKPNNPFCENIISFIDKIPPEFSLTDYVDYDIMFEKAFQDSVQNVVGPMGWSAESRATLEDFFA